MKILKTIWKKIEKVVQKRKAISIVVGALILGLISYIFIQSCRLFPNSDIYQASESSVGLFESINPSFEVTFGKKEDSSSQWIRFESETSNINGLIRVTKLKKRLC